MEFNSTSIVLIIVGILTWLIVILGIAKFAKFYIDFAKMAKDINNNFTNTANVLRKINNANLEMLFEQRRTSKLMNQLLSQFQGAEIVEEIINESEDEVDSDFDDNDEDLLES